MAEWRGIEGFPGYNDDLIAKAGIVVGLWDLMLFSSGNPAARQKRADVMHVAVSNLQAALLKQSERVAR